MPTTAPKRKKKPASFGGGASYTESEMDEFLKRQNLYRKPIAKDGSCLFRAVSEQVYQSQANHLDVRKECIDYMRQNKERFEEFVEGPFDHHLFRLQDPKEWAGQVEISALSLMYERDFVIYQDINAEPTKVTENRFKDKILLCYSNGNHYDAVYDIKYKKNAAFCQSLVYELLYKRVFPELDRGDTNRKGGLRTTREPQGLAADLYENGDMKDEFRENGNEDNDGWTEVKSRSQKAKSARQNRTAEQDEARDDSNVKQNNEQKYQWEIHRSVDAEQYRNVAIEVWEEDKNNQQRQDLAVAASIQYEANDRCYVLLGPPKFAEEKLYSAIVKEICTNQGTLLVFVPELKQRLNIPVQCLKPGDGHQGYRDLTGYYRKTGEGGSPASEEGFKDDGKGRRKKGPSRGRRGFNKGDEQEDGSQRRPYQEDFRPKPGGQREKFGRRGGRVARGREERNHKEEDAKLQEQLKLEELREKDSKSFPALPSQQTEKPAAPVIPVVSADMTPVVTSTGTPAEFWSRLQQSSGSQKAKQATTPGSSPAMSPTAPEAKANTPVAVSPGSPESKVPLSPTVLPSSPEVKVQTVPAVSPSQQPAPARVTTRDESSGGKVNREVKGKVDEGVKLPTTETSVEKEANVVKGSKDEENRGEKETKGEKEGKANKEARNETVNRADNEEKKEREDIIEQESNLDQEEKNQKMSTPRPEVKTPDTIAGTERPSFPGSQRVTHGEGVAPTRGEGVAPTRGEGVAPESDGIKKRPAEVKTNVSAADPGPRSLLKGLDAGKAKTPNVTKEPHETPVLESERSAVTVTKLSTDAAEVKDGPVIQEANKTKADAVNSEPPKLQDVRPDGTENESARFVHGKVVNGVFIRHTEEKRVLKKDDAVPEPELPKPQPLIPTESAPVEKKTVKFADPVKEEIEHRSFTAVPKGMLAVDLSSHARSSPPNTRKSGKSAAGKTGTEVARKGQAPKPSSPVPGVIPQDIPNLPVLPANHTEKTVSEDRSHRNNSPEITSRQSTQPAPESLLSAADMGGVQPSVSPQPQFQIPYAPFQTANLTGPVQISSGISVDPSGSDLPQDVSTLRYFYNMGYQYFLAMQQMQQPMMYYPMWPSSQEHIQQQAPVAVSVGQQLYPGMQGMQHMYPPQALSAYHAMHVPSVSQDSVASFDRSSNERNSPAQQTQQQMPSQGQSQARQQNAQPISGQQQQTMNLHQQQQAAYVSHQLRPTPRPMFPSYPGKHSHFIPHGHSAPVHQPRAHAPANSIGNPKPQYKRTKHNKPRGDAQSSYIAGTQFHNQATAQFGMPAFPNASQTSASASSQNYYLSADLSGGKGSGNELNPGTQPFMNYPGGLPANQRGQYS